MGVPRFQEETDGIQIAHFQRRSRVVDLFEIRSSQHLRWALQLTDLELGILCAHYSIPRNGSLFAWCGLLHEKLSQAKDDHLLVAIEEQKKFPNPSWEQVFALAQRGSEARSYLDLLVSSS